jgi:hypothetical protein
MDALRIANCSGFFGDRLSAAAEMVRGGPIDVLTGDYLAELTMAILVRQRARGRGFVGTFVKQMEEVMGECLARNIKIISNAGGLDPHGLARELSSLAQKIGRAPRIAVVEGDDLAPRIPELLGKGQRFTHLDKDVHLELAQHQLLGANAYLGGWGIAEALARGADIVVTGRVTDAALVVGPAAWKFGWRRDDWDRLAGAVIAGHIIECGPQACGGNYSFGDEIETWSRLGFPIAEVHADGSFVITKHPGTGGVVNVGTVTAQLLYEIDGARYKNPDVVARFDSITLAQEAPDRVRGTGARGEPAPATLKVAINLFGGYRNAMTIRLAGLDVDEKARVTSALLEEACGGKPGFDAWDVSLRRSDREDPARNEDAIAYLTLAVKSRDEKKVGKAFAAKVVELSLSGVAGHSITHPPADAAPFAVYWPALVDAAEVEERVTLDGESWIVAPPPRADASSSSSPSTSSSSSPAVFSPAGMTVRAPLGRVFGARSGDKGGNANLGVWARDAAAYEWLAAVLTVEKLRSLFEDLAPYPIERALLPNVRGVNFYIRGILGDGVAASTREDPQAKTLGEYFRARVTELPAALVKTR